MMMFLNRKISPLFRVSLWGERNCGIMWPSYTSTIINMVSHLLPLLDPVTRIACVAVK